MANLNRIIYLTEAQASTLFANDTITVNGKTINYSDNDLYITTDSSSGVSISLATSSAIGGIKIGYTSSGTNYAVELSNEQAYVSVPWTDTKVTQSAAITTSGAYPILLAYDTNTTEVTNSVNKTSTLIYNPDTKALVTGGTINGYTLAAACAKGVTDNSSSTAVTSSDTNLITARTLYYAGYLPLSGGTMDGDIEMGPSYPTSRSNEIKWLTSNNSSIELSTYENNFRIWCDPFEQPGFAALTIAYNGVIYVDAPSLWRDAIGAVNIAGDTMTGALNMGTSTANSAAQEIKWSTTDGTSFSIRPYDNTFQIVCTPSGGTASGILNISSNGNISVASPNKWRSALSTTKNIIFDTATWANTYSKLSDLDTNESAIFGANATAGTFLTDGKNTSTLKGIVQNGGNGTYDFFAMAGLGLYVYTWRITDLTSSSATPTVGTVYRYTGTSV